MRIFTPEFEARLRTLHENLEALRRSSSNLETLERIERIFHAVQTLEGAAQAVRLPLIERACRATRIILTEARQGIMQPDDSLVWLLSAFADAMAEAHCHLSTGAAQQRTKLESFLPGLEAFACQCSPFKQQESADFLRTRAIRGAT